MTHFVEPPLEYRDVYAELRNVRERVLDVVNALQRAAADRPVVSPRTALVSGLRYRNSWLMFDNMIADILLPQMTQSGDALPEPIRAVCDEIDDIQFGRAPKGADASPLFCQLAQLLVDAVEQPDLLKSWAADPMNRSGGIQDPQ
jgi:hypothetical protein